MDADFSPEVLHRWTIFLSVALRSLLGVVVTHGSVRVEVAVWRELLGENLSSEESSLEPDEADQGILDARKREPK